MWPIGKFPVHTRRDAGRNRARNEHHHRISSVALSRSGSAHSAGWSAGVADATARPAVRSLSQHADAKGGRRPAATCTGRKTLKAWRTPGRRSTPCAALSTQYIDGKTWIMGDDFTMADCAAAPALFYTDKVMPLAENTQECSRLSRSADAAAFLRPRAGVKRSPISSSSRRRSGRLRGSPLFFFFFFF